MSDLQPGLSREEKFIVTHDITAAALFEVIPLGVSNMPEVWSTPDMIEIEKYLTPEQATQLSDIAQERTEKRVKKSIQDLL